MGAPMFLLPAPLRDADSGIIITALCPPLANQGWRHMEQEEPEDVTAAKHTVTRR